jgi:integrase
MDRRKKGSGQITYVPDRKSPWRASVTDRSGKQKSRFFKTEREAKAFLREVNADANKLKSLLETGVTFSAFSTIFLEEKSKQNLKPTAYKALKDSVDRANEYVGRVMLRDIDSDMVQQMIYDLANKGYSQSIMTKAKQAVGSVLKMAAAKHYLDAVPVFDITIPNGKNQDADRQAKSNWMRDDEIRAYEEECKRIYVPKKYTKYAGKELLYHTGGYKLLFILHTGLRVGEALALTWADYDDYSKTILIDKNMVYVDGGKITQTPKTESGERVIVLNKQAVLDLQMLRKQYEEQCEVIDQRMAEELRQAELNYSGPEQKSAKRLIKEKYDAIRREHKYICGSSNFPFGSGVSCSTSQAHRKICKKIGLTHNVTVHGLRHTYVTHYYIKHKNDPDFDLATFSKSIGHSSIRTTMEIYAHLDMTQNRFVQRSMEDLKDF